MSTTIKCPICNENEARINYKNDNEVMPCLNCNSSGILETCGVAPRYLNANLDDFGRWARQRAGTSLFVHGSAGTGKTHLAVALMRDDVLNKRKCHFVTTPDMLLDIKHAFDKKSDWTESQAVEYYASLPNLYLDDIGVEKITDWAFTTLYTIIDRRYGKMLRTVITSNLSPEELKEHLGTRMVSRILGMCEVIEMTGIDRRLR